MKVKLSFLDDFNCSYDSKIPMYANEQEEQIGFCTVTVENSKHVGKLSFNNEYKINEGFYLSCKWHIDENELITVDKILLTEEVLDKQFSIQLKESVIEE